MTPACRRLLAATTDGEGPGLGQAATGMVQTSVLGAPPIRVSAVHPAHACAYMSGTHARPRRSAGLASWPKAGWTAPQIISTTASSWLRHRQFGARLGCVAPVLRRLHSIIIGSVPGLNVQRRPRRRCAVVGSVADHAAPALSLRLIVFSALSSSVRQPDLNVMKCQPPRQAALRHQLVGPSTRLQRRTAAPWPSPHRLACSSASPGLG